MPTYEYACRSCGQHLEVVQSFSDDPLTVCPNCGDPLRKVFGSIGFVLKGSGFYKNDSRPAAKSAGDGADSSTKADAPAAAGDGGSGKNEKSEKKSEKKNEGEKRNEKKKADSPAKTAS